MPIIVERKQNLQNPYATASAVVWKAPAYTGGLPEWQCETIVNRGNLPQDSAEVVCGIQPSICRGGSDAAEKIIRRAWNVEINALDEAVDGWRNDAEYAYIWGVPRVAERDLQAAFAAALDECCRGLGVAVTDCKHVYITINRDMIVAGCEDLSRIFAIGTIRRRDGGNYWEVE